MKFIRTYCVFFSLVLLVLASSPIRMIVAQTPIPERIQNLEWDPNGMELAAIAYNGVFISIPSPKNEGV